MNVVAPEYLFAKGVRQKQFSLKPLAIAMTIAVGCGSSWAALSGEDKVLEEIVIYAQKREQTVYEVPVSVSTYGAEALDRGKVRDLGDLSQVAPSLSVNSTTGAADTSIFIRGVGTSGNNPGFEQSVGVFIDGVYRGRPGAAMSDYVDIEGIEILKGPQGTLFGRNTSAGVINVRTQQPSYDKQGHLELSAGNYGFHQIRGAVSGAVVDETLAGSLSGSWQQRDEYFDNPVTGDGMYDRDRFTLRGQLLWDINDDASLRVIADRSYSDERCCGVTPLFYGPTQSLIDGISGVARLPAQAYSYSGLLNGQLRDVSDRRYATNNNYLDRVDDRGLSVELNWEWQDTELTVIAAQRDFENFQQNDLDHNAADLINRVQEYDIDERSLEVRLASTTPQTVDWTIGAFYFDQKIDYQSPLWFGDDIRPYFDGLSQGLISLVENNLGAASGTFLTAGGRANSSNDYRSTSSALFGQASWNISEALSVTLGLRYSDEEKESDFRPDYQNPWSQLTTAQLSAALGGNPVAVATAQSLQFLVPYEAFSASYDDDNLSATLSVNYQLDDLSVYARYASGYKSGGINLDRDGTGASPDNPTVNPETVLFDPETVDAYEIGFKAGLLENRMRISGALFYQTVEDFQLQTFVGTSFLVQNAAEIESKGIELDFAYRVSEQWQLSGGLVWQDVTFADFSNGPNTLAQDLAGAAANSNDLTGERVNQAPKLSASLQISYQRPINAYWEMASLLSVNYNSDYATEVSNEPLLDQDDSWLMNATLALESYDGHWVMELWGKNLTDEVIYDGFSLPIQQGSFGAYVSTAPKTYGVSLAYHF